MSRIGRRGPNVTDMTPLTPGSWPTPITSELVVRAAARLGEVVVDGEDVYWSESRPSRFHPPPMIPKSPEEFFFRAGGRRFVVRLAAGRFLLAAVDPERPRVDAGRRFDVVRAGMRRTVIALRARFRQAGARVPPPARGP